MAQINLFAKGNELSPETRNAINSACSNLSNAFDETRKAINLLRNEKCCFERTALGVADHFRILGTVYKDFEADCIAMSYDEESTILFGNLAIAEMKGIAQDLANINNRFDRVAKYLDLPSAAKDEFASAVKGVQDQLETYLGKAIYSAIQEDLV